MSEASKTPKVEVIVKKEATPKVGLAADAKAAKAEHVRVDEATAAQHKEFRDAGKIVDETPIVGYETARENMHVAPAEKVQVEIPEDVDSTTENTNTDGQRK